MPKRMTAKSVEISLKRCRKQAATLDDELLLYLIDITLLLLSRRFVPNDSKTENTRNIRARAYN
jgi:hypothetical protein